MSEKGHRFGWWPTHLLSNSWSHSVPHISTIYAKFMIITVFCRALFKNLAFFFLLFFFTFLHLGRWTMWHFGNIAACLRSGNLPLIYIFFVIYLHMRRVCHTNSVQSSESIWTVKIKDKHKLFHKKLIMTVSHHFLW